MMDKILFNSVLSGLKMQLFFNSNSRTCQLKKYKSNQNTKPLKGLTEEQIFLFAAQSRQIAVNPK